VTRRLEFSRAAIGDFEDIWSYTLNTWGAEQAVRYTRAIRDCCHSLARGERVGSRLTLGKQPFRKIRVGAHSIFLIESDDRFVVVRVLHARQDPDRELG
jgi:toxin ParE1/3/4